MLVAIAAALLFRWNDSAAEVNRTVQVRSGDTIYDLLTSNGVSSRASMELLSASEFIAARLDAIREGNTVEFVLDGESLVRIHVYGPERGTFNAWRGRGGIWQADESPFFSADPIASAIRQLEAGGIQQRLDAVRGNSRPVARGDRLVGLVKRAERDREAMRPSSLVRKRVPTVAAPVTKSIPNPGPPAPAQRVTTLVKTVKPDAAPTETARAEPRAAPARVETVVARAPESRPEDTSALYDSPERDEPAKLSKTPAEQSQAGAVQRNITPAVPPAPELTSPALTAPAQASPALTAPTKAAPARTALAKAATARTAPANAATAPVKPSAIAVTGAVAFSAPSVRTTGATSAELSSCPTIAGNWVAFYDHFDCQAEVAFELTPSGQYKMEQNGCGDIAGVVSLTGRSVAGQWEHLVCEGVLNVELDKTCKVGSGTWQANAGKALCPDKPYAVTIKRGTLDSPARSVKPKLTLFSGAASADPEPSGDR